MVKFRSVCDNHWSHLDKAIWANQLLLTVVFNWFEDIVDLDKLWLGDDHAKSGWGPGNQGDSGVDAETRVLAVQGWESSHETARVLKGELLARLEPKATLTGQAGGGGKACHIQMNN